MLMIAWALLFAGVYWFFELRLTHNANPNRAAKCWHSSTVKCVCSAIRTGIIWRKGRSTASRSRFWWIPVQHALPCLPSWRKNWLCARGPAVNVQTANGATRAYQTRLQTVRLGAIEVHDVAALITVGLNDDTVLLGMSFLKQLEFTQRGSVLTLKPLNQS